MKRYLKILGVVIGFASLLFVTQANSQSLSTTTVQPTKSKGVFKKLAPSQDIVIVPPGVEPKPSPGKKPPVTPPIVKPGPKKESPVPSRIPPKIVQKTPDLQWIKLACQESDAGKDPFYSGVIKLVTENGKELATYSDFCLSSTVLYETYCDKNGIHQAGIVECDCKGNACIGKEKIIPIPGKESPSPGDAIVPADSELIIR